MNLTSLAAVILHTPVLADTTGTQTAANPIASLLPFLLIGVVFYLLIIRPQRRKQQQQQAMIRSLGVGDEIVTIGGFHGLIVGQTDDTFDLEIADDIVVTIARNAVSKAVPQPADDDWDDDFDDFEDDIDGDHPVDADPDGERD